MKRLREKWPWNAESLRAILIIPSLIGIMGAVAFYPSAGVQSLWFLAAVVKKENILPFLVIKSLTATGFFTLSN